MNTKNIIEGNPTKKFFIEMITRDISIEDAIIDLLDNSIDGANRINSEDHTGLGIDITINESEFKIIDNCGGFSLETAQKYAFRFGRPNEAPNDKNSIGRFGIGMKRSLFKIGKKFSVETQYQTNEHFKIEVDVDSWSKQSKKVVTEDGIETDIDDWNFSYQMLTDNMGFDGTIITISDLNIEVRDLFSNDTFLNSLYDNIRKLLNYSLLKGLKIALNGKLLNGNPIEMLISNNWKPFYTEGNIDNVKYRIVAGLGDIGRPKDSGWYIYCNNRLVVEADTSNITGWGSYPIPQWHINYVMFRGLLFLDSEETLKLPLTTTKKGIDATSEIYKTLLPIMKNAMVDILIFLRNVAKMGNEANNYRQMLCETSNKLSSVEIKNYNFSDHVINTFVAPELNIDVISEKRQNVRIAYDVKKDIANYVKDYLNVKSYKDVGDYTFNYYVKMEGIRNEESDNSEL